MGTPARLQRFLVSGFTGDGCLSIQWYPWTDFSQQASPLGYNLRETEKQEAADVIFVRQCWSLSSYVHIF